MGLYLTGAVINDNEVLHGSVVCGVHISTVFYIVCLILALSLRERYEQGATLSFNYRIKYLGLREVI